MKAAIFDEYQGPIRIRDVDEPVCPSDGVVIRVAACGICRSDWHGWMGHDSDVRLPHVPGHELSGTIQKCGPDVQQWKPGQRVTTPFSCGCGTCHECVRGQPQICNDYTQPGFTHWGAFADYVIIRHADVNLVSVPDSIDFATAASLGCRFATSFRGLIEQAQLQAGESVAVFGCGGVGLSAVMIASAAGADVIAVDIDGDRLSMAEGIGAQTLINAADGETVRRILRQTSGGVDVSVDALGSRETCYQSIASLRKQGRHVQIGLTLGPETDPPVPMSLVIARELQLLGSHGMAAASYPRMLHLIASGRLQPHKLISDRLSLPEGALFLTRMDDFPGRGVTVIEFA